VVCRTGGPERLPGPGSIACWPGGCVSLSGSYLYERSFSRCGLAKVAGGNTTTTDLRRARDTRLTASCATSSHLCATGVAARRW